MSNFKKLVEARVTKTGESWSTAAHHVRAQASSSEASSSEASSWEVNADGFCGGCEQPVRGDQVKCEACGWILLSDPFECLVHDDLLDRQRDAIELELTAAARTGPRNPDEASPAYAARLESTMRQLVESMVDDQRRHVADEQSDEEAAKSIVAEQSERPRIGTLRGSELVGSKIELPTPCGEHVIYYPAILAMYAHRHQSCTVFATRCECGTAYIVTTEPDAAHFRAEGPPEAIESAYDRLPWSEHDDVDGETFFFKMAPSLEALRGAFPLR